MKKFLFLFILFSLFNTSNSDAKGWMGIRFININDKVIEGFSKKDLLEKNAPKNILVTSVIKNSPAHRANLLPGDIILEADNKPTKEIKDLLDALDKFSDDETINIEIYRNGAEKTLRVKLGKTPTDFTFEHVDGSEKYQQFSFPLIFAFEHFIINEKYFSEEIIKKYKKKGLVVSCIYGGSEADKKGIKLLDEIVMVDGKEVTSLAFVKGKYNELTIKRGNKIIKKTLLAVPIDQLDNEATAKLRCTSEFSDLDCASLIFDPAGGDPIKISEAKRWIPVLECCKKNNLSIVPFHNLLSRDKFYSLKMKALYENIYYYRKAKPEGYLDDLNQLVKIARKDLVEFSKYLKIYPEMRESIQYTWLENEIKNAVMYAAGTHADTFKSLKDKVIDLDPEDISRIKKTILSKINKTGLIDSKTINFLYRQAQYLLKAKEHDFVIENWNKIIKKANWKGDAVKYFDDIYTDLAGAYFEIGKFEQGFQVLTEGIKISKNNFQNLYYVEAYGNFLTNRSVVSLIKEKEETIWLKHIKEDFKLLEEHLEYLISLPDSDKQKLKKIDKGYFIDVTMMITILDMLEPKSRGASYYPLVSLNYMKQNPDIDGYIIAKPIVFASLIQASLIDDDLKNYQLARSELNLLISESRGNQNKLRALLNPSGQLISQYYMKGFYSEMDKWIKFIYDTFDIKKLSKHFALQPNSLIVRYFKAYLEKRHGNLDKAILINENLFNENGIKSLLNSNNKFQVNFSQSFVLQKSMPDLYELYYLTGKKEKFDELNRLLFVKNIKDLTKEDFELVELVGIDSFNIYKTMAKYYLQNNMKKQFAKLIKHSETKLINFLKKLEKGDTHEAAINVWNKNDIFRNIAEIGKIFIDGGKPKEGKKILDSLYPHVINYYNEQIYQSIWRPNIQDRYIGSIYLEAANNLKKNSVFQQKAYSIAQITKNTNTSRDIMKAITKKDIKDEGNLISNYQKLQQRLLVFSRNQQFKPKESAGNKSLDKKFNKEYRKTQKELLSLENKIKKQHPEYFDFLKIKTVDIKDLQQQLNDNQTILDYFFSKNQLSVVIIKKNEFKIHNIDFNSKHFVKLTEEIRKTLIPLDRKILPFAVNKSYELNKNIFLFLKDELKLTKKLIIIPDGPLNSLPLHVLATKQEKNCLDCRSVKFNLNNYAFSYLPTAETLINLDRYEEKFDFVKTSKFKSILKEAKELGKSKTGVELLKKITKKRKTKDKSKTKIIEGQLAYLGVGDPNLSLATKKIDTNNLNKVESLRSLFRSGIIKGREIKEIYRPVEGSAEEIKTVANYLKPLSSKILLQDDANEINLKEMDMRQFKIIHFATHGEISGALEGLNEPFLVLTPPDIGNENNDGLLTMTEIMALSTNADLVVLSACNTAAGDMPGSEGFSGLAKSFFISGSKSILVSNWYVETYSAQELVINLFKNIKDYPELTLSENFKTTMIEQMKKDKVKSHPLFWAPFVIVGKDSKMSFNM